jgi:hypothetical protein
MDYCEELSASLARYLLSILSLSIFLLMILSEIELTILIKKGTFLSPKNPRTKNPITK